MASPEQQKAAKEQREEREALSAAYKARMEEKDLVLLDILGQLDERYDNDYIAAVTEQENATKSTNALQRAHAYDNIRAYIKELLV